MNRWAMKGTVKKAAVVLVIATVLPAWPVASPAAFWVEATQAQNESRFIADQGDLRQEEQDRGQQPSDLEQTARDREQAKKDAEQEKKDAEQERLDHMQELYDEGRGYLDEESYGDAARAFSTLAQMHGPQSDAALYWLAYTQNKQGKRDAALSTIAEVKKSYPQSRWKKDAEALEIEIRQSSGARPNPDAVGDDELKLLALQGLMNSDPQKAVPMVEKTLAGSSSPRVKSKALFLLAQSGSPQAMDILGKVALGQSNPELQRKAVQYLGMFGGERAKKTLAEVYAGTSDASIKSAVLKSYMLSGDKQSLFNAAKNEKNDALKREAIKQLGLVGGENELEQLYRTENSTEVRREILQAFFLAGDAKRLVEAAEGEKDPELRRAAIKNLGLVGGKDASDALQSIYAKETERSLKEEVLNAYFLQGNSTALVAIARSEKDPGLRKKAVEKLSLIGDKTATDYMMEILQK
jgi:HEAT repeat protein